ncbi:retrovirus-related pol polyprotein from transposon RE1 [Tanacetum coccineum]
MFNLDYKEDNNSKGAMLRLPLSSRLRLTQTCSSKFSVCFYRYSTQYKGYRCLNLSTRRIYTTCHAQFDETYFPFSSTSLATPSVKILLSTYYDGIPMSTDQPTETSSQSCDQPVSKSPFTTPCDLCQDDPIMTSRSFVELSTPPLVPSPSSSSSTHLMVTRSNADIFTPRHFADLSYVTSSTLHQALFAAKEPKGFKSAAKHPKWFAAICDEMAALRQNATWDLFKARLVAQGFTQVLGLDYSATFSPIVKASTIRIVLSLIVLHKWLLHQSDVKMREMQENEKKQGKKGSECLIPIIRGLVQAIPTSLSPQPIGEATKASNLQRIPPGVQGRSHFTYFLYLIV